MATDEDNPGDVGFITYADDTPRDPGQDDPGFGAMGPPPLVETPARPRGLALAAGGAVAALVLALGAGALLKPQLAQPTTAVEDAAPPGPPMTVVVDPVRAPPPIAPVRAAKLEVFANPPPALPVRSAQPGLAKASTPRVIDGSVSRDAATTQACAGSGVARMICDDPRLARAERRMRRAYADALAAGAPRDDLRDDQDLWLQARDEAGSPDAMLGLYRERIQELRDLAEVAPQ